MRAGPKSSPQDSHKTAFSHGIMYVVTAIGGLLNAANSLLFYANGLQGAAVAPGVGNRQPFSLRRDAAMPMLACVLDLADACAVGGASAERDAGRFQ